MGQHKYNQTAIASKNGEIPPKPKRPSKAERERELCMVMHDAMQYAMHKKGLLSPADIMYLTGGIEMKKMI